MPKIRLRKEGLDDYVVLAACADAEGAGGIYCFDGDNTEPLDRLHTCSLAPDGGRLARLRWSEPGDAAGLLIYDLRGVERYYRLDGLGDAHQAAWDNGQLLLVSTATNSLVWLSQSGETRSWTAPGKGDAWHLNGVFVAAGQVFVSAFGRFSKPRQWEAHRRDGSGIVFELATGRDILTGLNCPHSLKYWDGKWYVCSAADHALVQMDNHGAVERSIVLEGWTRGLAASDDFLFVGVSMPRHDPASAGEQASIAILSRRSWTLERLVPLDTREISDLALVPASLAEGVRRGFSTSGAEQVRRPFLTGARLLPHPFAPGLIALRVTQAPSEILAGQEFICGVRVANDSPFPLESVRPYPIHLAYHWLDGERGQPVLFDGLRTALSPALLPGERQDYVMRVAAPPQPGRYRLRCTLVQESVRWLDEPPTNLAADVMITVGATGVMRAGGE